MARLRRISDGAGDEGASVLAVRLNPKTGKPEYKQTSVPIVGWSLQVGSVTARSYSQQDWWMTTPVTEILEAKPEGDLMYVKFKTGNSIYEFWGGDTSLVAEMLKQIRKEETENTDE